MRSVRSILALGAVVAAAALPARAEEDGWKSLFNGKDLDGWRTTGAIWKVEDGMIVGTIGEDRGSGYCLTKEDYGDYEIQLECKLGYPIDTGVFLRTTDEGKAYQVTLDNRPDGHIGAIYIAGINTEGIKYLAEPSAKPLKKDDWNQVYIRIEGKAPHITVKVNGEQVIDVTDTKERHQAKGPIGLQVHGGNVWKTGEKVWYRNIRIKPISDATALAPKGAEGSPSGSKFKSGSCCDKAAKNNSACAHPCCVEAAGAGKVCAKCNPGVSAVPAAAPAKKYKDGGCCDKAAKAGGACAHPCCKDAEAAGKACEKCNGAGQGAAPAPALKGAEGSPSGPAASPAVAVKAGPATYVLAISGMT